MTSKWFCPPVVQVEVEQTVSRAKLTRCLYQPTRTSIKIQTDADLQILENIIVIHQRQGVEDIELRIVGNDDSVTYELL